MNKIEIKELTLIFGTAKKQALKLLAKGTPKDIILQNTKCTVAVNNVNLSIKEGEIFVIMGLSGCGKSSLLRCLNRLNTPTQGSILMDGKDITKMGTKQLLNFRRSQVGMVFQHFGLLPHRNILDNVAFALEIQGVSKADRHNKAREIIAMVGLSDYEHSYPNQLSGGMQQRVGIARALASDSQILLMDEAFSALDPLIRSQMQDELLEIQQQVNKTIIFITHDLDEALKLGNTIAIMKEGSIIQQGTPEEILLNPADDYVKAFISNVYRAKIITAGTIAEPFNVRLKASKDTVESALRLMERHDIGFLPVIGDNQQFVGYINKKDAKKLAVNKDGSILDILIEVPKVSQDQAVSNLVTHMINQKYPLAVVDEKDRPVGFIKHADIINMVTGDDNDDLQTSNESSNV